MKIIIEDYKLLNCVRVTSLTFQKDGTVSETIRRIGQKGNVQIPSEQIDSYCLVQLTGGSILEDDKALSDYGLKNEVIYYRKGSRIGYAHSPKEGNS